MKKPLHILTFMIILFSKNFLSAENLSGQIPADSWEQYSDGLALTMTFLTQKDVESQNSFLKVYLKNTSTSPEKINEDSIESGLEILSEEKESGWHSLRVIDPMSITRSASLLIKPGETVVYPVKLSSEESRMIRTHSVRLHLSIMNKTKKQLVSVYSSPKKLAENVIQATAQ